MARAARIIAPDIVHHVVARGVNQTRLFRHGFDKGRYLKRLAQLAEREQVLIHGYCLMDNHVHLLLTPHNPNSLARLFGRLHTWWATLYNKRERRSGHLFQNRYHSSPLSESHYWTALRYVEINPVRARLVTHPEHWPWSSAYLKLRPRRERRSAPPLVPLIPVTTRGTALSLDDWQLLLRSEHPEHDHQLRRAHRCSQPCGPPDFLASFPKPKSSSPLSRAPASP